MPPRILTRVVDWVRAHLQFCLEFVTHGSGTWVFIRTWKSGEIFRLADAIIDRYYVDPDNELTCLSKILCSIGSWASLISLSGGSPTLVDCYKQYLGSGYTKTLVDYLTFDVQLLKWRLKKAASVVFGTLDPFSRREFIVTRLKGAEHGEWMQSMQSPRMAIETGDLSLPGLLDAVRKIFGVCLLIVCYLKETGEKDSSASVVVYLFLLVSFLSYLPILIHVLLFRKKRWMDTFLSTSWAEWSFVCSISSLKCVGFCIISHVSVGFPYSTCIFCMEILRINIQHSQLGPNFGVVGDF